MRTENLAAVTAANLEPVDANRTTWRRAFGMRILPTLRMTSISTNCAAIWTALSEEKTPPVAVRLHAPMALRVWRRDWLQDGLIIAIENAEYAPATCNGCTEMSGLGVADTTQ
jgi:hypothetical protein